MLQIAGSTAKILQYQNEEGTFTTAAELSIVAGEKVYQVPDGPGEPLDEDIETVTFRCIGTAEDLRHFRKHLDTVIDHLDAIGVTTPPAPETRQLGCATPEAEAPEPADEVLERVNGMLPRLSGADVVRAYRKYGPTVLRFLGDLADRFDTASTGAAPAPQRSPFSDN